MVETLKVSEEGGLAGEHRVIVLTERIFAQIGCVDPSKIEDARTGFLARNH